VMPIEDRLHGGMRSQVREARRPAATARRLRRWLKRLPFGPKALHRLHLTLFPHPRRHPPRAGLPATGETVDLARRLLGPRFLEPPLPSGAHGRQRPGLALIAHGARAAPAVEATALLTRYRPLSAEAMTVAYAGTAALLVFAVGTGLCHPGAAFRYDAMAILKTCATGPVNLL
jgi:hypothetical protein